MQFGSSRSNTNRFFFLIVDYGIYTDILYRKNKVDLSSLSRHVKLRKIRNQGIVSNVKHKEREKESEMSAMVFENKSIGRLLWLPLVIYFVEYIRARLKILIRRRSRGRREDEDY